MPEPTVSFDMATVVAQFTALRHDVNLQTKATRAATEQTAKVLDRFDESASDDGLKPVVKSVLDVADALTLSLTQVQKLRDAITPLLTAFATDRLSAPPMPQQPGFLAGLFGVDTTAIASWAHEAVARDSARAAADQQTAEQLTAAVTAAVDGYAMSLRRVERAMNDLGLQVIDCLDEPFDAETMEVVEIGGDGEPNHVTEVLRRGYTWKERIFRCAQVRVAGGG